jgi:hypothetical protein
MSMGDARGRVRRKGEVRLLEKDRQRARRAQRREGLTNEIPA